MSFEILAYKKTYQPIFEKLNMDWLNKYFKVEPIDVKVLGEPEKFIIEPGGAIYFVSYKGNIIGTAALKVEDDHVLELTKMAVDPIYQGLGAGKYLCKEMIHKAREMGYGELILYSNRRLTAAINIYLKLGFKEIPLEEGVYERADIKMKIVFDSSSKYPK